MNTKQTEALKLALKKAFDLGKRYWQQANSDFTSQWRKSDVTLASFNQLVEDTIRDALAEQPAQQQEPVAWLSRDDARLALWDAINKREFGNPTDDKLILDHLRKNGLWIGKYTSPPASKPWVGLTDVEWMNIVNKDHAWFGQRPEEVAHEVAKLVEAKLREKNA